MINRISKTQRAGFSLVEIVAVVAILGILASVGIGVYGKITTGAQSNVAINLTETLNGATRKYSHANWDLQLTAVNDSTNDEFRILRTLQWREPDGASDELIPKGPFMPPDWNPTASSSTDDYRIQWTGSLWKLLYPGDTGAGLKVTYDGGSDILGKNYEFPDDFAPVGPSS